MVTKECVSSELVIIGKYFVTPAQEGGSLDKRGYNLLLVFDFNYRRR